MLSRYLIDRFGVRRIMGYGILIAAFFNTLVPTAVKVSLPLLCVLRFICGATTQGVRWSAQNSVAGKWCPLTELGLLFGIGSVFSMSGNMLANTFGAILCTHTSVGWSGLFYAVSTLQGKTVK